MDIKELVYSALEIADVSMLEACKRMGWITGQLTSRLARGSLRADEFYQLMDCIGIEVKLIKKETGGEVTVKRAGAGRRIQAMVGKVKYDTARSNALANSFYADGEHEYNDEFKATELYQDNDGRFFFAEYTNWEGGVDRISPVNGAVAAAFIEKYGTELHKKPVTAE